MNDRSISSIARTIIYGLLIIWVFKDSDKSPALQGALTGFVIADMSTWMLRSFMDFFRNTADNLYTLVVYGIAAYVFNYGQVFESPKDNDSMAICFLVMLFTIGVKMTFFWIDLVTDDDDDYDD